MWLIKIGGSLIDDHAGAMPPLVRALAHLGKSECMLAVAGGGIAAELIRTLDRRCRIGDRPSHWMAIAGMELNAYRLAARYPGVFRIQDALSTTPTTKICLLLPARFLGEHPLPESWDVTSDTIAAHLAHHFGAMLVLAKAVDGIRLTSQGPAVLPSISAAELTRIDDPPVDPGLPAYLMENRMDAILVNGLRPGRLEKIVKGKPTTHTRITGRVGNAASG